MTVARIVGFVVAGFVIGLAAIGGAAAVARAPEVAAMFRLVADAGWPAAASPRSAALRRCWR